MVSQWLWNHLNVFENKNMEHLIFNYSYHQYKTVLLLSKIPFLQRLCPSEYRASFELSCGPEEKCLCLVCVLILELKFFFYNLIDTLNLKWLH